MKNILIYSTLLFLGLASFAQAEVKPTFKCIARASEYHVGYNTDVGIEVYSKSAQYCAQNNNLESGLDECVLEFNYLQANGNIGVGEKILNKSTQFCKQFKKTWPAISRCMKQVGMVTSSSTVNLRPEIFEYAMNSCTPQEYQVEYPR